jgi:hypothetical protein
VDQRACWRLALSFLAVTLGALPTSASAKNSHVQIKGLELAPGAKHAGSTLSRDALRNCVSAQRRINANADALDREEIANAQEATRLDQLSAEVDKRKGDIDRHRKASIDNYNELVDRHARAVEQYNAKLPSYNFRTQEHYKEVLDFDAKCAHKAYYKEDLHAIAAAADNVKK